MDAATRAQIMGSILAKPTISEAREDVVEATVTPKVSEDNIFKFKDKLKYVHAYSKIIKEDDENWSDEQWQAFAKWYEANKPKVKTLDLVGAAFEKKALREQAEEDKKKAIRKMILEKVKFKL